MFSIFFFNDTATTEIYTLSLHDALPISPLLNADWRVAVLLPEEQVRTLLDPSRHKEVVPVPAPPKAEKITVELASSEVDRKSTRLNSSHTVISYAVFCLKKEPTVMLLVALLKVSAVAVVAPRPVT